MANSMSSVSQWEGAITNAASESVSSTLQEDVELCLGLFGV